MGNYRKKPVEIDAFNVGDSNVKDLMAWVIGFGDEFDSHFSNQGNELKVKTLEGTSYNVPPGYWIIRGVAGEYYPCEPIIFEKTYDKVN